MTESYFELTAPPDTPTGSLISMQLTNEILRDAPCEENTD